MKAWKVTTSNQYKTGWFDDELNAIQTAHVWNCNAIKCGQSERWHVEAVEEPEPVDLGRVAYEASAGEPLTRTEPLPQWKCLNNYAKRKWWDIAAAVVAAGAVPKKS